MGTLCPITNSVPSIFNNYTITIYYTIIVSPCVVFTVSLLSSGIQMTVVMRYFGNIEEKDQY